jgi:hypothetical protein
MSDFWKPSEWMIIKDKSEFLTSCRPALMKPLSYSQPVALLAPCCPTHSDPRITLPTHHIKIAGGCSPRVASAPFPDERSFQKPALGFGSHRARIWLPVSRINLVGETGDVRLGLGLQDRSADLRETARFQAVDQVPLCLPNNITPGSWPWKQTMRAVSICRAT